jgi:hypothetical protein
MGVKVNIPCGVAKEGVELAQGGVKPLVAPSETAVLKMYLFELAVGQGSAETIDAATVDSRLILVACPMYLVKVAKGKPFNPGSRLQAAKLIEEFIFPIGGGRPVNISDFEFILGVDGCDSSRHGEL